MFTDEEKKELLSIIKEAINEKKLTKAEIMAVKDTAERQRLIAENMDLFTDKRR